MEIGIIGLGKMGGNIAKRLMKGGHAVVAYDRHEAAVRELAEAGAIPAPDMEALAVRLSPPRVVWIMVPAGEPVHETILALCPLLAPTDIVIDGGNSHYKASLAHASLLGKQGIHFLDVGVSGGVWGLEEGYSLTMGGKEEDVRALTPVFESLAPAPDKGWGHVGPNGSGHFVKMIHNGIEYGLMEAYAEGFAILEKKDKFSVNLAQISEIWQYGSVIRSWLLNLTTGILKENKNLDGTTPYVQDSGEGRWALSEAIDLDIPTPVLALALLTRLQSRDRESFSNKLLTALRHRFGGHRLHPFPPHIETP